MRRRTAAPRNMQGEAMEKKGWRVAYVNVNGLQRRVWDEVRRWIENDVFDLVFTAETWCVNWREYRRWKGTIAATDCRTPSGITHGRQGGGLALFGSARAKEQLVGDAIVAETNIVVQIGRATIAGLYLRPSLPDSDLDQALLAASQADVVVGDFNFRIYQPHGSRCRAVTDWARTNGLTMMRPWESGTLVPGARLHTVLTTDYAFIRQGGGDERLYCLDNRDLGLQTDHLYTLGVILPQAWTQIRPSAAPMLCRYNVGRLAQANVRAQLCREWSNKTSAVQLWLADTALPVSCYEDLLRSLLTQVCDVTLGRKGHKGQLGQRARLPLGGANTSTQCIAADGIDASTQFDTSTWCNAANGMDASTLFDASTMSATHRLVKQTLANDRGNQPLLPSQPGEDALAEATAMLQERYTGRPLSVSKVQGTELNANDDSRILQPWTPSNIVEEISRQESDKACGSDGVHIQMLKALLETNLPTLLADLFNRCLRTRQVPSAWHTTEIYLLVKDKHQPRTPKNVRPITIVAILRKVFECLLLQRIEHAPWAALHPAQAGFRKGYSAVAHAAYLHGLLRTRVLEGVVFLDFSAAFDRVDHTVLYHILCQRGCPRNVLQLLVALLFEGATSRVLANGDASAPFARTCGVPQGSPLSPLLWNIFVDGLLYRLNAKADGRTRALFFADDGVLLVYANDDAQALLDVVVQWCSEVGIQLNVRKCGSVFREPLARPVRIGEQPIPEVRQYTYLGFPVTIDGIDFAKHLQLRLEAALARATFFEPMASTWGPAHRVRVYYQYLAPMFEYGAPLAWAWKQTLPSRSTQWATATSEPWKALVAWIGGSKTASRVTRNLLGLPTLENRFESLHTSFQWHLERANPTSPLRNAIQQLGRPPFFHYLQTSPWFCEWKRQIRLQDTGLLRQQLASFLQKKRKESILLEGRVSKSWLLTIVNANTRLREGCPNADRVLALPLKQQEALFRYRRGVWGFRKTHDCKVGRRMYHRGQEDCPCFGTTFGLSRSQKRAKAQMEQGWVLEGHFTDIDFLLNIGRFDQAARRLDVIERRLGDMYAIEQTADEAI